MDRGAWWAAVHGVESWTRLKRLSSSLLYFQKKIYLIGFLPYGLISKNYISDVVYKILKSHIHVFKLTLGDLSV